MPKKLTQAELRARHKIASGELRELRKAAKALRKEAEALLKKAGSTESRAEKKATAVEQLEQRLAADT